MPERRWTFQNEGEDDEEDFDDGAPAMRVASYNVFHNANEQKDARVRRRAGIQQDELALTFFVAYTPNYTAETKQEDRHEFWLGKITELDNEQKMVKVRCMTCGQKKNATGKTNPMYKGWHGPDKYDWISLSRIILQMEERNRILAKERRRIANMLAAATNEADEVYTALHAHPTTRHAPHHTHQSRTG